MLTDLLSKAVEFKVVFVYAEELKTFPIVFTLTQMAKEQLSKHKYKTNATVMLIIKKMLSLDTLFIYM